MIENHDSAGKYAAALGPAQDADAPADSGSPPPPQRIIEALLFAGGQPLTPERAANAIRNLPVDEFQRAIDALARDYRRQNRPYAIQATAQGFVLSLKPRYQGLVDRLTGAPREARLSRPAVEVLSLIAFRQPVTRAEIDSQRGSDSSALVRQLVRLGLIAVVGAAASAPREEAEYVTTPRFLELFGLQSLDDLPRTDDLQLL
jgi:segregation and condensation protein B